VSPKPLRTSSILLQSLSQALCVKDLCREVSRVCTGGAGVVGMEAAYIVSGARARRGGPRWFHGFAGYVDYWTSETEKRAERGQVWLE
jgi:hypothetical protein